MRSLLTLSVALLFTTAAQAETFTFTGKVNPASKQIAAPGPTGKPIVGASVTVEMDMIWASAGKVHATYDCIVFSAPPTSGQTIQGVCAAIEPDGGKFSLLFNCLADEKSPQSDCWGRIAYSSGKKEGRVGTMSWHDRRDDDGKAITSVGAGNLN